MRKLAVLTTVMGALVATLTTHLGTAAVAETGPGIVHTEVVVEAPTPRIPRVKDGKVWAIIEWGDLVVVGGKFSTVRESGGADVARSNIFAFSRSTGKIDTQFAPVVNGSVRAIAIDPDGRGLFVGGTFNQVNGATRRGLIFLDRDGQRVRNWAGRPNGSVFDLAVRDRELYVGGKFSRITGVNRPIFASVNVANGQTTNESTVLFDDPRFSEYRGVLEMRRFEISPDGSRMVVLGNFQLVDGQVRDQVAVLDVGASPDSVASWSTSWYNPPCNGSTSFWPYFVRDVAISPDNSYFVIASVGGLQSGPPNPCDQVTRFELPDGLDRQPTWISYAGGDSVLSVEVTGEAVYTGGHFRWLNNPFGINDPGPGAIARGTLGALDPATGTVLPWNPGRQPRGQGVLVMEASTDGLWIGHDTGFVNGVYSPRLTHFSLPGLAMATAEPEVTEPEATEPEATEPPAEDDPEVTEPEAEPEAEPPAEPEEPVEPDGN